MLLINLTCVSCAAKTNFTGVYSNNSQGFKVASLVVHKDGYASFGISIGTIIGEWSYDSTDSILSLKYINEISTPEQTIQFKFDPQLRTYQLITPNPEQSTSHNDLLKFITGEVPDDLIQIFKEYSKNVEGYRAKFRQHIDAKRRTQKILEREEPEYQRVLQSIRDNPSIVLTDKLYLEKSGPVLRAMFASFKDKEVHYSDPVLASLLDALPPENHWYSSRVFSQSQLSSETIEKYYPQALNWDKLNYSVLVNIAKHSNTPVHILEELSRRPGLSMSLAKERLKVIKNLVK